MKTLFGLLLLSGVLAAQDAQTIQEVPCRLLVSDLVGGPRMLSMKEEMASTAYNALKRFLKSQYLGIDSVVCVTEQLVEGSLYQVQYNGYNWVQIYSSLTDESQIIDRGVIPPLKEQPF